MKASTQKLLVDVALFAASQAVCYFAFKWAIAQLDPSKASRQVARGKGKKVLGRLGADDISLTEHEQIIASEAIHPDDITVRFRDIGGLDPIIDDLRETVIYPLRLPHLFVSARRFGVPKGVLLYGPPGCGKTLMAKAVAKEAGATFLNMRPSILQDKYFGESNKLVSALFSLATKLQPTIIFIDEIDSFMRERSKMDHEVSGTIKAEFMSSWDGLTTSEDSRIIVLGCTNRLPDIDSAILRRMPKRFAINLPNAGQRRAILDLLLKDIDHDLGSDVDTLVRMTEGSSGSELHDLCRDACMVPAREIMKNIRIDDNDDSADKYERAIEATESKPRPLNLADFIATNRLNIPLNMLNGTNSMPIEVVD